MNQQGSGGPPDNRLVVGNIVLTNNNVVGPGIGGLGHDRQQSLQVRVDENVNTVMAHPGLFGALGLIMSGGILVGTTILVQTGWLPGIVFLGSGFAAAVTGLGGGWLLSKRRRAGSTGIDPSLQSRLLEVATAASGRLTVTQTAQSLGVTFEEAERMLGVMTRSGYVDAELESGSNVVVYVFREIAQRHDRQLAG